MKKTSTSLLIFLMLASLNSALVYAQQSRPSNLFETGTQNIQLMEEMSQYIEDPKIISVNILEKALILDTQPQELRVKFPFTMFRNLDLDLKKFDVLASNSKIISKRTRDEEMTPVNKNNFVSYTGSVLGIENSFAVLCIGDDEIRGIVITDNDTYVFGKIDNRVAFNNEYILYQASKLKVRNPFVCHADEISYSNEVKNKIIEIQNNPDLIKSSEIKVALIALEVDNFTYNSFGGSIERTTNYVMSIMTTVSAIYLREIRVKLEVPYIRIWTEPDPYNAGNLYDYLTQFANLWDTTQGSVNRTLAHFITKRTPVLGGIGYLGVLCNTNIGYGFSNTSGTVYNFPVFSWDIFVVAHELGHNFGSNHTHNCSWPGGPIDTCYIVEGNCYNGPVRPIKGTILSYCYTTQEGINLDKGFGPLPRALMRVYTDIAPCLQENNSNLMLSFPIGGETYYTRSMCRIMWASTQSRFVNLYYSTNNGSVWDTIATNVSTDSLQMNWQLPLISTSNECKIMIVDIADPTIADTMNNSFTIRLWFDPFSITEPHNLSTIHTSRTNTDVINFKWSNPANIARTSFKLKFKKEDSNLYYSFISNNNGTDTIASIRNSQLDSLANFFGTSGDSVKVIVKVQAYNNFDSAQSWDSLVFTLKRTTTGITQISEIIPDKFELYHNYPNPFNPTTKIKFDVPELSNVRINIYDINGREVATLVNSQMNPGRYTADWYAANFASGIYFYRMVTDKFTETRKMILIK